MQRRRRRDMAGMQRVGADGCQRLAAGDSLIALPQLLRQSQDRMLIHDHAVRLHQKNMPLWRFLYQDRSQLTFHRRQG